MSDISEMVDAKETPLTAEIDDSCTVQYIEITPLVRPSDDCCKQECIEPVLEVKPEDLQDVIVVITKSNFASLTVIMISNFQCRNQ